MATYSRIAPTVIKVPVRNKMPAQVIDYREFSLVVQDLSACAVKLAAEGIEFDLLLTNPNRPTLHLDEDIQARIHYTETNEVTLWIWAQDHGEVHTMKREQPPLGHEIAEWALPLLRAAAD